jgi:predicted nucleic acid-binding protein
VSVYLDASVIVSLFVNDSFSDRADRLLVRIGKVVVSDFAAAEFAAVVMRKTRTRELRAPDAERVFADFDAWCTTFAEGATTTSEDIAVATTFVRRSDLALRVPDAINVALSRRLDAPLATFDERMAESARTLGVAVVAV